MNRVDILIDNKEKFFSCFKKSSDCDCWNWERYKDKDGYGQFQFSHLKEKFIFVAHRASYEINVSAIPFGMLVCHKCDNPSCVNPSHLFLGTNLDNTMDKVSKNRQAKADKSGRAKLKWDDVNNIRNSYSTTAVKDLSKKYIVDKKTILSIVKNSSWIDNSYRYKHDPNRRLVIGEVSSNASLDSDSVKNIKKLISDGYMPSKISKMIGVKSQTIRDIKRGVSYSKI